MKNFSRYLFSFISFSVMWFTYVFLWDFTLKMNTLLHYYCIIALLEQSLVTLHQGILFSSGQCNVYEH